ncbi:Ion transport 2 domain protein [Frankia canadensis]|uniref:Ion transport 2 domain protein n=1 Tax=Frankia canadensis TaxID=1836972 RepID=A0A2I2KYH9_9ACTN|nr:Ion transport 2 domain protein [Frankia canadensis]SOU57999.1 Ion transport 2 domain protein [Frankia canadensis]
MGEARSRASTGRRVAAALATLAAVLVVYYCLPLRHAPGGFALGLRIFGLVAGLALLGWLFVRQVAAGRRETSARSRSAWLFAGICVTVVLFATTYYSLAYYGQEMAGIRTRTDALYFTVTVLTTVGFGDIRAVGQTARVVVTLQMGFDVLFVATAGSVLRATGPRSPA